MLTVEHAAATIRFSTVSFDATSRRLSHSVSLFIPRDKFGRLADNYAGGGRRACKDKNGGIKATAKDHFSSGEEPVKQSRSHHPSEDIGELELMENEDAQLKPAECSRTIIEVNSKVTLMFSSAVSDVMHANIFWPDLPYTTDELGNVYFQVKNDEDVLKNPTEEENVVVVTDDPIDFMDQPPAGLVIQGLLRPAFLEAHAATPKQISEGIDQIEKVAEYKKNCSVQVNGHKCGSGSSQDGLSCPEELEKDETIGNGTSFYKLEMIKIQLISSHGHQILVELDDFSGAKPDAIAHSAANIISRLKAVGENTTSQISLFEMQGNSSGDVSCPYPQ